MAESQDLAVRYEGEGLPVLMVHGWEMSGSVEAHDFEPIFTKKLGYRRIYIDLPGMGKTPAAGITSLESIFERACSFVEKHILPSNFLVVGSSCGAYLARALAYKYASAVDGLLLRVPLVEPVNSKRDVDPFEPAIKNDALLSSKLSDADREKLGGIPVQTPEYIRAFKRRLEATALPALAVSDSAALDPIRNDDNLYRLTAPLHSPERPFLKPTLVLTGRQDGVVGYRDAWPLVKCYPRATFVALDRADHGLPVDETDLFEALVVNWLWRVGELRRLAHPASNE